MLVAPDIGKFSVSSRSLLEGEDVGEIISSYSKVFKIVTPFSLPSTILRPTDMPPGGTAPHEVISVDSFGFGLPVRTAGTVVVAATLMLAGISCDSPLALTILAASSCLAMTCQQSSWWSSVSEIGGRNLGALFGLLNMMGIPGAMASQFLFGVWADWRKAQGFAGRDQWDLGLFAYVGLLLVGAVCWWFVDTSRSIDEEQHGKASIVSIPISSRKS